MDFEINDDKLNVDILKFLLFGSHRTNHYTCHNCEYVLSRTISFHTLTLISGTDWPCCGRLRGFSYPSHRSSSYFMCFSAMWCGQSSLTGHTAHLNQNSICLCHEHKTLTCTVVTEVGICERDKKNFLTFGKEVTLVRVRDIRYVWGISVGQCDK